MSSAIRICALPTTKRRFIRSLQNLLNPLEMNWKTSRSGASLVWPKKILTLY